MREDAVHRLQHKTMRLVLDKNNITSFIKLGNRRDVRSGVVNRLTRVLEQGLHFETPLVTNLVGKKHRLLDGNHRIEAIETYLKKHPGRKVEVGIHYYNDLSIEEERNIYTKWNLGTKQNTNDFVKQYWDTIPLVKMLAKEFPWKVGPTWSTKSMEFKTLVSGYLTIENPTYSGGYRGSAQNFIEEARGLTEKDYKNIRAFLAEYMSVFGNPDKKSMHYRQAVFYSMFKIWHDNMSRFAYDAMLKVMVKIRNHERVVYYSSMGGTRENCQQCRLDLLRVLNANRTRNKLI